MVAVMGLVDDTAQCIWIIRSHSDAGVLRPGETQSMVHLCLCHCMRNGIGVRISSRRVAFWVGGSDLGRGGAEKMVAGAGRQAGVARIALPGHNIKDPCCTTIGTFINLSNTFKGSGTRYTSASGGGKIQLSLQDF
jgi:hypothetical protein